MLSDIRFSAKLLSEQERVLHKVEVVMVLRARQSRAEHISLWSKAGHFTIALSKGAKTTTWIWNLHSDAHDFYISSTNERALMAKERALRAITRKVFSSNLAHLSLVFFWISGMHFHGAYFANADIWNKDPKHYLPSAHNVSSLIGQDILNSDIGNYFQGTSITSGLFQLWRSEGIIVAIDLKYGCSASLIGTIMCMSGSYFHMHIGWSKERVLALSTSYHLALLFGLSSISWSGHQIHISLPTHRLLDSGIDPVVIPWLQDLVFNHCQHIILRQFTSNTPFVNLLSLQSCYSPVSITETVLASCTEGLCIGILRAHHFYLALVFITSSLIRHNHIAKGCTLAILVDPNTSNHGQLSINLLFAGSNSIAFGHHIYAIPMYPYIASDYPTVLSLFYHQINIGATIIIGAAAHASIKIMCDSSRNLQLCQEVNYLPAIKRAE